jgi:hypothetical protein
MSINYWSDILNPSDKSTEDNLGLCISSDFKTSYDLVPRKLATVQCFHWISFNRESMCRSRCVWSESIHRRGTWTGK